jgi:hypothetical protein
MPSRPKQHTAFQHLVSYDTFFFKEILLLQLHMELRLKKLEWAIP